MICKINSVKALQETSWSSRSGLNHTRTTPPCYNNTTLGNCLYAQRKGPSVTNPICLTRHMIILYSYILCLYILLFYVHMYTCFTPNCIFTILLVLSCTYGGTQFIEVTVLQWFYGPCRLIIIIIICTSFSGHNVVTSEAAPVTV